jgi:hypothetical protein
MNRLAGIQLAMVIAMLGLLSFIPQTPGTITAPLAMFAALCAVAGLLALPTGIDRRLLPFYLTILLFSGYLVFNGLVALLNGIDGLSVLRSVAPFLFLGVGAVIGNSILVRHARVVMGAFLVSAVAHCVQGFVALTSAGLGVSEIVSGGYRLTYVFPDATLPYALIGTLLSGTVFSGRGTRVVFVVFFLTFVLLTKSKGMVLSLLAAWALVYWLVSAQGFIKRNRRPLYTALGLAGIVVGALNVGRIPLMERFQLLGTADDVTTFGRLQEIRNSFEVFKEHPILGAGSGYQFEHFDIAGSQRYQSRRYTHFSLLYALAIWGLAGAFLYVGVLYLTTVGPVLRLRKKVDTAQDKSMVLLACVLASALAGLHILSLTSASYKLIHVNFSAGLFSALLANVLLTLSPSPPPVPSEAS